MLLLPASNLFFLLRGVIFIPLRNSWRLYNQGQILVCFKRNDICNYEKLHLFYFHFTYITEGFDSDGVSQQQKPCGVQALTFLLGPVGTLLYNNS